MSRAGDIVTKLEEAVVSRFTKKDYGFSGCPTLTGKAKNGNEVNLCFYSKDGDALPSATQCQVEVSYDPEDPENVDVFDTLTQAFAATKKAGIVFSPKALQDCKEYMTSIGIKEV